MSSLKCQECGDVVSVGSGVFVLENGGLAGGGQLPCSMGGRKTVPCMSDQRGHGTGVSLDVYTKTSVKTKAVAARRLENSVLRQKIVPIWKPA